jgi:hypothetical protein
MFILQTKISYPSSSSSLIKCEKGNFCGFVTSMKWESRRESKGASLYQMNLDFVHFVKLEYF